jgi:hypothetical protein
MLKLMVMNKNYSFLSLLMVALINSVSGQPWVQNDGIFNPSGIPSLPFSQPRFADLDNDGDPDMIIGNTSNQPYYLVNSGTPLAPAFTTGDDIFADVSPLDAEMGVFCDMDGDSDPDFISGGFTGLNLFTNIGDVYNPEFVKMEGFFDGLVAGYNPVPDLADVDDDDDPDLVVGFSESGMIKVYTNTGSVFAAIFSEENVTTIGDVGLYAYPVFCDIDHDLDQDILSGRDEHGFIFYRNLGTPQNPDWQPDDVPFQNLGNETYWNSPDLVDMNDDDKFDLVFGTFTGPLNYYVNTGTSEIPAWQVNTTLFGGVMDVGSASNPFFYDYDYDGDFDLFTGSQLGDIKYYENTGTPTGPAWLENSAPFASLKHSIYSAVTVGDVNGDSLPDAIVGDLSGNLYCHLNNGSGFIFDPALLGTVNLGSWSAPRLVDMNGDGDLDIVAGNESGVLAFLENQGSVLSPLWVTISGFFSGIDVGSNCVPSLADIDFDGDPDLVTGDLFSEVQYFENQEGNWIENNELLQGISGGQNTTPALCDLDGDGDPDLTLGNYNGTFNYYTNQKLIVKIPDHVTGSKFIIQRSYPNPFSQSVNITYEILTTCDITLNIYNPFGKEVHNRSWNNRIPGNYNYEWDASGLTPGVYFIQLSDGISNQVMKVIMRK